MPQPAGPQSGGQLPSIERPGDHLAHEMRAQLDHDTRMARLIVTKPLDLHPFEFLVPFATLKMIAVQILGEESARESSGAYIFTTASASDG